jgi:hypothetical protein
MALTYGGTGALPAVQDSEYLANALANLQSTGAQASKTPLALGSNLLAEALLQVGRHKNNQALLKAYQGGQSALFSDQVPGEDAFLAGLNRSPSASAPTDPTVTSTPPPPVTGGVALERPSEPDAEHLATSSAGAAPAPQGALLQALLNKGLNPWGAAGLVGNMANESGPNLNLNNPNEGAIGPANWRGPRADAYRSFLAANGGQATPDMQASFIMQELGGPEARAYRMAQAATDPASATAAGLAYERPAGWSLTNPQASSAYGARLASTQALGPQAAPSVAPTSGPPPASPGGPPGAYQVASNGPTPPPAGAAPMQAPPGAGAPQAAGVTPQPFPIQPAQFQMLEALRQKAQAAPQLYGQQYLAYRNELQTQAATPEPLEIGRPVNGQIPVTGKLSGRFYGWQSAPGGIVDSGPKMTINQGPNGPFATPVHGTTFQADANSPPNATRLTNPSTGEVKYADNPAYGPVAAGQHLTAGGVAQVVPGTQARPLVDPAERKAAGIQPYDRAAYVQFPNGTVQKTADDPFGPAAQLDYTSKVQALPPYRNYVAARQNVDSIRQLMNQPGGFNDLAIIENTGKTINPDIAIRPNMIDQYGKEVGWPDWLIGEVSSVMNHGGHLTQQGREALYNTANANLQSHWNALQPILSKVDHDAARYGVTRQDLLPDLQPMMPAGPPSYPGASIPGASGAPNQGAIIDDARAAIARGAPRAAVIQRVQSMGVDPRGL